MVLIASCSEAILRFIKLLLELGGEGAVGLGLGLSDGYDGGVESLSSRELFVLLTLI